MPPKFLSVVLPFVLTLILLLPLPPAAHAQQRSEPLWQLLWLTPTASQRATLVANLDTFVTTYDLDGPCHAWIMEVATGPQTGHLILERGPLSTSDLDATCSQAGTEYWDRSIQPYIAQATNEFFLQHLDLSVAGSPDAPASVVQYVRFLEVQPGNEAQAYRLMRRISETVAATQPSGNWEFFSNYFEPGNDRRSHFAVASYHSSMGELAKNYRLDAILDASLHAEIRDTFVRRTGLILR